MHFREWRQAGRPGLDSWLARRLAEAPEDPLRECRISYCDLWAREGLPFCLSHGNRWKERGPSGRR
jgi:hypothetical protein